jgi:hypothetical protein
LFTTGDFQVATVDKHGQEGRSDSWVLEAEEAGEPFSRPSTINSQPILTAKNANHTKTFLTTDGHPSFVPQCGTTVDRKNAEFAKTETEHLKLPFSL